MKHCVIAIKDKNDYRSIICHYEGAFDIGTLLRTRFKSYLLVSELINMGDLNHLCDKTISSFHKDWGYYWSATAPVRNADLRTLINYSDAVGATHLHVFEDSDWESLIVNEPEEYRLSA